jgi:S-adenosylmethionine:tRNA ribosyltransferase-isomerase
MPANYRLVVLRMSFFDYYLPKELIAQKPVTPRDYSRMIAYNRNSGSLEEKNFFNLVDYLKAGDVLVLNNSKVVPARLKFEYQGKEAELLFLEQVGEKSWKVLGRPGKMLKIGNMVMIDELEVTIKGVLEGGLRLIEVNMDKELLRAFLLNKGQLPIPPYIVEEDFKAEQYQTVFSAKEGSVAAPTAGLHFTPRLLSVLQQKGVIIEYVTLHVGLGTFLPIKVCDFKNHKMHKETYSLDFATAKRLNIYKKNKQRIIAVGTTTTRVLEDSWSDGEGFVPGYRSTDIFIFPGYKWKAVDALITNFHLPKSTLLLLVASLVGEVALEKIYTLAIRNKYRFFSFGDAMFIY